ncbi:MAG: PQQ-binding-like beta-propeller repeat protein, partial [Planctomycetia bacterium]
MPKLFTGITAALAAVFLAATPTPAGDWPRFLGPNGSSTSLDDDPPVSWKDDGFAWRTKLPGLGASSPVVVGGRVFTTAAERDGSQRYALALDAATGELLWKQGFTFDTHKKHDKNTYATATPTADGERVYVAFTDPGVYKVLAFTAAEGKLVWEYDVGSFTAQHGSGASPILYKNWVVMANDQDGPSSVVALEAATGKVAWKTERASGKASYSTPIILNRLAGDELVFLSAAGMTGLDAATGRQRWVYDKFPARTVGSPVAVGDLVVGICGSGNKGQLLNAVRTGGEGNVSESHLGWSSTRILPYCVTPLAVGKNLYLMTDTGILRCLAAADGAELWTERLAGNFSSSPI